MKQKWPNCPHNKPQAVEANEALEAMKQTMIFSGGNCLEANEALEALQALQVVEASSARSA